MKRVRFQPELSVPDFEQLLVSPDLSNNALKGLVLHYEKNRRKMEDQLEKTKKEYASLKSEKSKMPEITKNIEHELKEFRKENYTIKSLETQISILTKERDSALAMWASSENQLQKLKEENVTPKSNDKIQLLLRELQTIQRDYSDAIHLLELKLNKQQEEKNSLIVINERLKKDLEMVEQQKNKMEEEMLRLEEELSKLSDDKTELSHALEKCLSKVNEAIQMEQQARSKVSDAVDLAQQALSQQDVTSEEKIKLQKELEKFTESTNLRYKEEMGNMMKKLKDLAETLEISEKEKKEVKDEFEHVKLECYNKLLEVIEKNKTLSSQCKDLHHKSYTEKLQWSEERKMLRTQIMTLQSCIEQVNINLREQKLQFPCKRCTEMQRKASNYKKIASRWRKVANEFQDRLEKKDKSRRRQK